MLLFESSRDNLLMPYLNLMREKGIECSLSQLKQFLLAKFVNEGNIRSLSLESNYYLAGVARYYFEGKLTVNKNVNAMYPKIKDVFNQDICQRLSVLIVILRNAYIDSVGTQFEQPEDFGTLSLEKLLRKYNKAINAELGIGSEKEKEKPEKVDDGLNRDEHVGDGYTFDILYSYEDAKKYHRFTEPGAWCITYGEQHYNGYIRRLKIHYVIFRKNGWENVPRQKGPNWTSLKPQDEYGNSLIALLQSNENGAPVYITSRWNHGSYADNSQCEADHAYTPEEFKRVTGVSDGDLKRIFDIWEKDRKKNGEKVSQSRSELNKKRANVLRIFKYAQMRINGGNFDNAFGDYSFSVNDLLSKDGETRNLYFKYKHREDQYSEFASKVKKILNDSVKSCTVEINGENYFFLMDKNKILFETIVESDSHYDSSTNHFITSMPDGVNFARGINAETYNNAILCNIINGTMIYDFRRHNFVEVDGKKKFKYVAKIYNSQLRALGENGNGFYEVKMSDRQCAFIDWRTNKPLKLPNGSSWFEYVEYPGKRSYNTRNVSCEFVPDTSKVLKFLYDTSSGEQYYYDIETKKFFNPGRYDIDRICKISSGDFPFGIYTIGYGKEIYTMDYFVPYKAGEPVEINGISKFKYIIYVGNDIIVYEDMDGNNVIYDCSNGNIIEPPFDWSIIRSRPITERYYSKDGKLFGLKTTINYTYEFLFSLRKKEFLLCPEEFRVNENPYIFKIHGVNMNDGYITMFNKEQLKFRFHVNDNGDLKEPVFIGELRKNKNLNFGVIREAVSAVLKKYIGCI